MPDALELDGDGRLALHEGKTLAFKRDLSSPTKPLRTIVAFANSAGGRLVIGVDDNGAVAGVADPLSEEERITNLISDRIAPLEEVMEWLRFTVFVPSHAPGTPMGTTDENYDSTLGEQGVSKSSEQVSKMSEQAMALLAMASEDARSRTELLAGIDLSNAYGNYRRHLLPLIEDGYLARTVPDKPNSQHQRYRITVTGREILAEEESTK